MPLRCRLTTICFLVWVALTGMAAAAEHWAFVPPEYPASPRIEEPMACRGAVDAFVLARLEQAGRSFSPETDRSTLIRRLSLDLRGLPPTLAEVEAFVADTRPDAYDRPVDRFLSDSAYGEKMASFWLDLARFGDTNGFQDDGVRTMWLYRDYVIDAFNQNMPFDRFTVENLAGDLLPNATIEQRIASGFNRNHRFNEEGGSDPEEFRVVYVVDRTNTTATTWLGLTFECAQCHDHKYDPISQKEYYRLYAFFNNNKGELGVSKARKQPPFLELPTPEEEACRGELTDKRQALEAAGKLTEPEESERARQLADIKKELRRLDRGIVATMVMEEQRPRRATYILKRGDFRQPGEAVSPGVPAIFPPLKHADEDADASDRLTLARSFMDPARPLVARVLVHRLWYQLFGRGLVSTLNDFGLRGYNVAENPMHTHDLQATILHLLGIDHERLVYRFKGRDFRLTDVSGEVVESLLSSR